MQSTTSIRSTLIFKSAEIRYLSNNHTLYALTVLVATWERFKWGNMPEPRMYRGERR